MLGNSSSGIIEMPSYKKGTINIGNRQNGRIKAKSIIDVDYNEKKLSQKLIYCIQKDLKKL